MTLLFNINLVNTSGFYHSTLTISWFVCVRAQTLSRVRRFPQGARRVGTALISSRYRDRGLFGERENARSPRWWVGVCRRLAHLQPASQSISVLTGTQMWWAASGVIRRASAPLARILSQSASLAVRRAGRTALSATADRWRDRLLTILECGFVTRGGVPRRRPGRVARSPSEARHSGVAFRARILSSRIFADLPRKSSE